jgi:hypothetical protein
MLSEHAMRRRYLLDHDLPTRRLDFEKHKTAAEVKVNHGMVQAGQNSVEFRVKS